MTDEELYKLTETVIHAAQRQSLKIATAESCTGGWIAKCLTDIPGSSAVYEGGLVSYSNDVKENLLGVSSEILNSRGLGAVCEQTAFQMAKNCAQSFGVNLALSVTGIAGPGGGSKDKPVGLVYMGVYFDGKIKTEEFRFEDNGRDGVRRQAVVAGLKLLETGMG